MEFIRREARAIKKSSLNLKIMSLPISPFFNQSKCFPLIKPQLFYKLVEEAHLHPVDADLHH
jgi:hypothetical protein